MENGENDLRQFLQRNQPVPPPAPPGELERILLRVKEPRLGRPRAWWLGLAAAAAIFLVVLSVRTPTDEPEIFEEESLPTFDVGEDYLEIASIDLLNL
ncbi:MAG: hypothetical protein HUU37_07060 [Bdellovibrionales bacterium]|nr:hypothetical protein [Bdellovibrionales bacterium]